MMSVLELWSLTLLPAIAFMLLGACTSTERNPPSQAAFTDVTADAGLGTFRHLTGAVGNKWMPETLGGGGGFIDYDGDGWQDVLLVRGATWEMAGGEPSLALYRNEGDGTFSEVTAGLEGVQAYGFGITSADIDNDGDEDFYLTTLHRNMLFRNDGGTFVEVGEQAGVAGPDEWSTAAVFFDADGDGLLDLYVANYVAWSPQVDTPCSISGGIRTYCTPDLYPGLPARFYRNNGGGRFSERTSDAGFGPPVPGKSLGAAVLDYNEDGWMDLVVVNDTERDLLYENAGNGTFNERGILSGIAFDSNGKTRAGMGVNAGVVDSTGRLTVFIGNFAREMVGAYRYSGSVGFVDRAVESGIARASVNLLTFGLLVTDVDLDGHLDVFTANGHIMSEIERVDGFVTYREPARLYRNRGNGTFEVLEGDLWNQAMVARSASYADYDRDGDTDILLVENGGPAHLWRNEARGNYLRVRLEGSLSNRSAIGARVAASAGGRSMHRQVHSGGSYLANSERTLTFGLGGAQKVDTLVVRWPSGTTQTLTDIDANREILIREGVHSQIAESLPPARKP